MARVEIREEIDTEGEKILINCFLTLLRELKVEINELKVKGNEKRIEYIIYKIDDETLWLNKHLYKLER